MPEINDNAEDNLPVSKPVEAQSDKTAADKTAADTAADKTAASAPAPKAAKTAAEETPLPADKVGKAAKPAKAGKPAKASRRARTRRRWPVVLAGAAALAVAVAAVGAASLYPGVDATAEISLVPHPLPVGESLANCQGPTQLLAGSSAGADPEFSANSSKTTSQLNAVVLSGSTGELPGAAVQTLDGKFTPLFTVAEEGTPTSKSTKLPGAPKARAGVVDGKAVAAPSVLRMQPLGEQMPQGSGSVVVAANDGDLAGLAAANCQRPSSELWLSGASTSVGRTALLAISNSSPSPASVSLELFGDAGPVAAPGGKDLVVAPGTVRTVVLAGLAPDQELLSIHLKSTGGAVSAVIQQSVLRGLTPGGVDYLSPVQNPASKLSIPGVRVQAPGAAAKISAQSGYKDAAPTLVVTVPGAGDSVVEVKAHGPEGQVALPNGGVFTAAAGKVSNFSLAGLPKGTYSLSINADAPVTAGVQIVNFTKPGEAVDLALAPSAARLGNTHLVSLPQEVSSTLVFSAPEGESTVTLVPISTGGVLGAGKDVQLKAGKTATVDPASLLGSGTTAVVVSVAGAPTFGTQLLDTGDSANIAVLPIVGTASGAHAINIITGY
ncbi:DUF5719 family protein [Arthrobacter sp. H35-D1]|uniref:DUF5719 family protein n=1 Tax=Arthrobacter sp. H35-D1 TaxID=3046202 RepID=UPI0024BB4A01|nr:DUF5719 family protein [Arthrobacter sp. H35-D1]MDJ0312396.1 DUF5719 family protein [Arthrobacter sp. H35-D1]